MKTNIAKIIILAASALPFASFSQNIKDKKDEIVIRIEKEVDGKKELIEKKIDVTNLNDRQRDAAIQHLQDSLMTNGKGAKQRIKIEIEDENVSKNNRRRFLDDENRPQNRMPRNEGNRMPRNEEYDFQYRNDGNNNAHNEYRNFDEGMSNFGFQMKRFGEDFPRFFEKSKQFGREERSSTIRGLEVFPNNPHAEVLNINFRAMGKGDVYLKVMNIKGDVLGKDEIKNFEGEYVGQVNIGTAAKGTYFVMVTQGEDGTVKRFVIP